MSNLRVWLTEQSSEQRQHFLGEIPRLWLESGQLNNLYSLLSNYDFIEAKINHPIFGVQALIEDYNLIDKTDLSNYLEHNDESIKCLKLIQQALELSSHILAEDTTQLASQLWGRLQHSQIPQIQQLLQTTKLSSNIWLRPLSSSLIPAGGRLQRILTGHTSAVNVVTITSDAKRAISGSKDGALKVWDLQTGKELFSLKGHKSSVTSVVTTSDNKYIISSSEDETLRVWDFANGKELFKLADRDCIARSLAVTLDGRQVISLQWDKDINQLQKKIKNASSIKVIGWNLITRKNKILFESAELFENIFLSDDGKYIALCFQKLGDMGEKAGFGVRIINLRANQEYLNFIEHKDTITAFTIASNKRHAVSASKDKTLITWDLASRKSIFNLTGHDDEITTVTITHDGKQVISVSKDRTIKIWSLETGKEIDSIIVHSDLINSIATSSDSKLAVSASQDKTLKLLNLINKFDNTLPILAEENNYPQEYYEYNNKQNKVKKYNFFISRFNLVYSIIFSIFTFFRNFIISIVWLSILIAFLFIFPYLAVWAAIILFPILAFLLWLFPIINFICRMTLKATFTDISKSRQENQFLTNNFINVYIYGDLLKQYLKLIIAIASTESEGFNYFTQRIYLNNHSELVTSLAVNQNNQMIISGSNDKTIRFWNLKTGEQIFILNGHRDEITSLATIPNSNLLISSSLDKNFKMWDLVSRKKRSIFKILLFDSL